LSTDITKLLEQAQRERLYGRISVEFRAGVPTLIRTEKTQILNNEDRNNEFAERHNNR